MNTVVLTDRQSDGWRIALPVVLIFFVMAANTAIVPVLKESVKDRIDEKALGWFLSLSYLGSFLCAPLAGWLSDRSGHRKTWIVATAALSALSYLWMSFFPDPYVFFAVRFFEGAVGAFVLSLLMASVGDLEVELGRPYLMGLAGMTLALGGGLGMPLGAAGKADPAVPFMISAGFMALVSVGALALRDAGRLVESSHTTVPDFFKLLRLEWLLFIPLLFVFIDRFTAGFVTASLNLHLRETLHLGPGQTGSMLGLVFWPMGLLSFPVALLMKRTGVLLPVLLGSFVYGLALLLLGWTDNVVLLTALLALAGLGAALMFVPTLTLASRLAPESYRGTAIGAYMGIGSLGFLLGPLASVYLKSMLADYFEGMTLFAVLSGIFGSLEILVVLVVLPLYGWIGRRLRQSEA